VEFWRNRAGKERMAAQGTVDPLVREDLLRDAETYELWVKCAEKSIQKAARTRETAP
jgi:hypothetical protein